MSITLQATGCSSDVLQWLVKERHASPGAPHGTLPAACPAFMPPTGVKPDASHAGRLKISVQQLERFGRGLIATEDAAPGEVLLSVPFTTVFMDTEVLCACCPWKL